MLVDLSDVSLTAIHCRMWLAWSRACIMDTATVVVCVMFSNGCSLSLQSDSRRTFIWRVPGTPIFFKRTSLNDTVPVEQDGSFGGEAELFWVPELNHLFRLQPLQAISIGTSFWNNMYVCLFRGTMGAEFCAYG
ncbi:HTH_Tnp_Tc3_2 domain-containing protein [Trichonephila clavipes]|uniref:HTH_Tnp_Tc3_2 domain-containing protein n=1 Tax=Trichonephila clavipes TaxID=2585209 RepID=A0A8X6VS95_TRICX|nr:HTH_Tnp_Tc3_2 domain-containing protein [Trichonephila clavipes]